MTKSGHFFRYTRSYGEFVPFTVCKLVTWSFFIFCPSLFLSWTTETSFTRNESCCVRGHLFRAVQTLSLHLSPSVVGDVFEHASDNDSVWTTLGARSPRCCSFCRATRCLQDARAIQFESSPRQCHFCSCNCHFSGQIPPCFPHVLKHWWNPTNLSLCRKLRRPALLR